ncbi:hypothetical protein THARTR1_07371 [Trichoderma harzianum]|uniref:PD-(D/E)XK nuclease-like domain-containing protein n=1 Tax=Trichoderma harzianum TaxID=5544 RepID=A0A2K0U314_TRIHA|nr:hypothetical protein THARTR1_07371 [Trichoderma harzianum]
MDDGRILSWVCTLPEEAVTHDTPPYSDATRKPVVASGSLPEAEKHDNPSPLDATRKRKRKHKIASGSCLADPSSTSMSADSGSMASTLKKRRLDVESADAPVDLEAILRPAVCNFPSSSASISLSTSRSRAGSASRSSSPKKQMMSSSLDDALVYTELVIDTVPMAAKKLYETLEDLSENKNTLPRGFQQAIAQQQAIIQQRAAALQQTTTQPQAMPQMQKYQNKIDAYEKLKSCCRPESAPVDNLPGRIPSLDEMDEIVRKAVQVATRGDNESRWNGAVNLRLLDMIFEDPLTGPISEFGATDCTTAQLHKEFRPVASTARMVDDCIFCSFADNKEWTSAIKKFAHMNPAQSINHTDFVSIQYEPLLLSIETKKPAAELDKAKLQIGIWHAAQWNFLEWAVGEKLLQQRIAQGLDEPATAQDVEEFKEAKVAALSALGFIPGIIVSGYRWVSVLSTYDRDKKTTILWTDTAFGTTRTIKGAYAAVAGVRELTAWGRDVYLPWFKEHVLVFD